MTGKNAIIALMRSTSICHAAADTRISEEIAQYLAANCPTEVRTRMIVGDEHLLDTVESELSGDFILVLLSPDSAGRTLWNRERWEDILFTQPRKFKTTIAYLLIEQCKFPELLRRKNFFDQSHGPGNGRLEIRRWLLSELLPLRIQPKLPVEDVPRSSAAALQELERIAGAPGTITGVQRGDALRFARKHCMDFEATVWIDCARRTRAGVLGDMAQALNLCLAGTVDRNETALREYCGQHRILLVLDNLSVDQLGSFDFSGRASVVFTKAADAGGPLPLEETVRLFDSWSLNSTECLANLSSAQFHAIQIENASQEERAALYSLGFAAVKLLKAQSRLAEAEEFLRWMWTAAFLQPDDNAVRQRCQWESSWIRETWDLPLAFDGQLHTSNAEPVQLGLFN